MIDEKKARRVIDFIQCLKHTKGEFHGKPFRLLPWQEKIIRDVFGTVREDDPTMRQYTTAYIEIPKKQGKALVLSTLLPTPQGWKRMDEIQVGDQVFDEAGRPCNVVALSEVFDNEPCYRLTFRDGNVIEAGEQHLWRVEVTNNGKREKLLTSGEIYHRTMAYRKRHPGDAGRRSVIRIPLARALQLPERELPIDPYLMGYWLGNGKSTDYEITVRDSDQDDCVTSYRTFIYLNLWSDTDPTEMADRIRAAMYAYGFFMVEESDKGYNQPAYDTATSQFTVQWTWCWREEVERLAP